MYWNINGNYLCVKSFVDAGWDVLCVAYSETGENINGACNKSGLSGIWTLDLSLPKGESYH